MGDLESKKLSICRQPPATCGLTPHQFFFTAPARWRGAPRLLSSKDRCYKCSKVVLLRNGCLCRHHTTAQCVTGFWVAGTAASATRCNASLTKAPPKSRTTCCDKDSLASAFNLVETVSQTVSIEQQGGRGPTFLRRRTACNLVALGPAGNRSALHGA